MLTSAKARDRRFHHGYVCPRCKSPQVQRWGRERTGTQRYRCGGCRRTFNDLTRTAMAGTHLPEKWRVYADTMRDGQSTRKAGERIGVDHKTAWRWRHKVMAFLAPTKQPPLSGIVEADETYFRRNFKGSKPIGRRSRKRGTRSGSARGLGKDKVAVVAALRPVLSPGVTLCTDGSRAMRGAAHALPVWHVALVTARSERKRGIYHIQTVNRYQGRLKGWIARFRGVATQYLLRYLTWHIMDKRIQRLTAAQARAVLVGNTAELSPDRCCPNRGAILTAA
jgi:transposase-like protein